MGDTFRVYLLGSTPGISWAEAREAGCPGIYRVVLYIPWGSLQVATVIHTGKKVTYDYLSLEHNYFLHISVFFLPPPPLSLNLLHPHPTPSLSLSLSFPVASS